MASTPTTTTADTPSKPTWYIDSLDDAQGWSATRELLLEYTKIPEDQLADHVYKIVRPPPLPPEAPRE